jgi:hypothetical protein
VFSEIMPTESGVFRPSCTPSDYCFFGGCVTGAQIQCDEQSDFENLGSNPSPPAIRLAALIAILFQGLVLRA